MKKSPGRNTPWWLHHYVIVAALSLLGTVLLVAWTELASCPDCAGKMVVATGFEEQGSHAKVRFLYKNFSSGPWVRASVLTVDSLTPQSPAAVALSDTRRCEARDRRDISPEESFSEAALVKKPAPGFSEIIQAIQNPIKIYQLSPTDLPMTCWLTANPTWLYFETRRLRFLHWIAVPPSSNVEKMLSLPIQTQSTSMNPMHRTFA